MRLSNTTVRGENLVDDEIRAKRYSFFVGIVTLVLLGAMIVGILWQSAVEWGSLPSTSGNGIILYGGVAVALLATILYVVWSWLNWKSAVRGS